MDLLPAVLRRSRLAVDRFHHSGVAPSRVLVIGDRVELLEPDGGATLAERIADRIWLTTRRGVDLDVLTDLAPVLRSVDPVLRSWRLARYDVVLVVVSDRTDSARRGPTPARVMGLLEGMPADVAGATDLVVLGSAAPARRGRHGALPADDPTTTRRDPSGRVRFRAVPAGAAGAERFRAWSAAAAEEVVASTRASTRAPEGPDDEDDRQRALDALLLVGRPPDARLDDLAELARTAFGTESAEINFIDRDQQWKMATAGSDRAPNPRAHSFCASTIQRREPTVVSDAALDPVLRSSPLVTGPKPIRFYAAHPIESADGYRIGSFCVYDSAPRDVASLDIGVLRDLALLAQAEITGADRAPTGSALRR